jgi:Fe2+ transport system protein FeoA
MRPGAAVQVLEKAPLGGPVTIAINGSSHAVSLELARMITVIAAPESSEAGASEAAAAHA